MDWITYVPFSLPFFPALSWAVLIWLGLFVTASAYIGRVARRCFRAWRAEARQPHGEADRLIILGDLLGHSLVLAVCAFGLVVGFMSAHIPQQRRPLTVAGVALTLLFLGIAAGLACNSYILDRFHRAALRAIRRERLARLEQAS